MMRIFSLAHILRHARIPALLATTSFLVAGCGGGSPDAAMAKTSPSTAAGVVLNVSGSEYAFAPSTVPAKAGQTTIRFTNKGVVEHDLTITALGIHLIAKPGKSAEVTVTLKPGTYTSYCTVPGHLQSGMHGKLVVK